MNSTSKSWFVLYTKPRWEKKVSQELAKRDIEHYCPVNKVVREWRDRKKVILQPLFSCYVFVKINPIETTTVLQAAGAVSLLYWLKKPAQVSQEEIDIIQKFTSEYDHVDVRKTAVKTDDRVRIIGGPLMEREGKVLEIRHKTVTVSLPSLGFHIVAEIDKQHTELIPKSADKYQRM